MINILLLIGLVGAIVVSVTFAGMTFLQGVQSALDAEITHQRLMDAATQIQSHARTLTGTFALPEGSTGSSPYAYNQVPTWITYNARGANGVPFEYCPYAAANNGGTAGTVTMGDGTTTYAVKYTNSALTNSNNYVTDNNGTTTPAAAPTGTVGLLIAAAPNQYYPPNCSSISSGTNSYPIVSGGIVAAIGDNYLNKMQIPTAMTDLRFYVSSAATGDSSGRDASNFTTLTNALTIIQALNSASAMIYVDSTNCTATGTPFPCNVANTINSATTLSFGTRIYVASTSGTAAIEVTGGNITIDEYSTLALGNGITLQMGDTGSLNNITVNGTLEMADNSPTLTASTIQVYGGKINGYSNSVATNTMTFNGNVTIDGGGRISSVPSSGTMTFNNLGNRGFNLVNGSVLVGNSANLNPSAASIVPVFIGAGGNLYAGTGTTEINTVGTNTITGGAVIDPGGRLIGTSGTVRVNDVGGANSYGFYNHGLTSLYNTTVSYITSGTLVDGITLASGGRLEFVGSVASTLGAATPNDPTNGIDDKGGSILATANPTATQTVFGHTNCWPDNSGGTGLFSDSPVGTTNNNFNQTNLSAGLTWLRLYNSSYNLQCKIS